MSQFSEIQRKVIELEDKFKSSNEKQIDSSSPLYKEVKLLIEETNSWSNEDKQFMANHITKELIKSRVELKKKNAEKDLDKLLNKLGTA
ncbi:hypothetical protein [Caviibacterium pharyngocola]|uniref:Uncharacterized protein n=1 Tax=Caviibacterium pharyngocola TaxID=28159 RepID=A0A2M8RU56_9PAST|nr:hypothetical protein [Caviibacterium pharyngocola]PJG82415.1 hypothetical protein CVP04_08740 [Caviibacterium pharyngocola]